mgnify:CR=1 FL=1
MSLLFDRTFGSAVLGAMGRLFVRSMATRLSVQNRALWQILLGFPCVLLLYQGSVTTFAKVLCPWQP